MPKAKRNQKYIKKYDEDDLQKAIKYAKNENSISDEKLSLRAIARKFGVPKSTLENRLKNSERTSKMGPKTILSTGEEKFLEELIFTSQKKAQPKTALAIRKAGQVLLQRKPTISRSKRKGKTTILGKNSFHKWWHFK